MLTQELSGLWVLAATFDGDVVDHGRHAFAAGLGQEGRRATGFVACGSTGEAALADARRAAVLDTVLQAAGLLPVVMGIGYHLPQMLAWMRELGDCPLHGWLVPSIPTSSALAGRAGRSVYGHRR